MELMIKWLTSHFRCPSVVNMKKTRKRDKSIDEFPESETKFQQASNLVSNSLNGFYTKHIEERLTKKDHHHHKNSNSNTTNRDDLPNHNIETTTPNNAFAAEKEALKSKFKSKINFNAKDSISSNLSSKINNFNLNKTKQYVSNKIINNTNKSPKPKTNSVFYFDSNSNKNNNNNQVCCQESSSSSSTHDHQQQRDDTLRSNLSSTSSFDSSNDSSTTNYAYECHQHNPQQQHHANGNTRINNYFDVFKLTDDQNNMLINSTANSTHYHTHNNTIDNNNNLTTNYNHLNFNLNSHLANADVTYPVLSSTNLNLSSAVVAPPPLPGPAPHQRLSLSRSSSSSLGASNQIVVDQPQLTSKLTNNTNDMSSLTSSNSSTNISSSNLNNNNNTNNVINTSTIISPSNGKSTNAAENSTKISSLSYLDENNLKLAVIDFSDLNKLIKLQNCIDLQEWVAFKTKMYFDQINVLYGAIADHCTPQTCPHMNAPCNQQFSWVDEKGKKYKYPASQYIDTCLTYISKIITDESLFPTKMGVSFPSNFEQLVKKINKHLFQILAHMYHAHYKELVHLKLNTYLNSIYFHFYLFNKTFSLLEDKDLEIMDTLNKSLMRKYLESTGQAQANHFNQQTMPTIHQPSSSSSSSSSSSGFSFFKKKLNFNIMA